MLRSAAILLLTAATLHAQVVVRPVELPRGEHESVLLRFYTGGQSDPAGKGIALVDDAGNGLPYRLLMHDPKGETVLAFAPGGAKTVTLRYGAKPDTAAEQRDDLPVSLIMRTWSMKQQPQEVRSALEIGRLATRAQPDGVAQVPSIHMAHNPFGASTYFYSEFEGLLKLKESADLKLLSVGDDVSHVEIDGKPVLEQTLPFTSYRSEELTRLAKPMTLGAGVHRVKYRHVQLDRRALMILATIQDERAVPVPAGDFVKTPTAALGPAAGADAVGFDARKLDQLAHEEVNYIRYELSAIAPAREGERYVWTFSDGVKRTGDRVEHVMIGPAAGWTVKVERVRGEQVLGSAAGQVRHIELDNYANIDNLRLLESYAQTIASADYTSAPPATLSPLYALVSVTERSEWMAPLIEATLARGGRNPQANAMRYILATHVARSQPQRARELFETIARSADDSWLAARAAAEALDLMLYQLGQAGQVEKQAREWLAGKQGRDRSILVVRIGDAQRMAGQFDQAADTYRTAQRAMQRQSDAQRAAVIERGYRETAISYLAQRRYPALRELLFEWEANFPLSKLGGDLTLMIARYCQSVGDHARAAEELRLLVEAAPLHPSRPELLYRLVESLRALNRGDEAAAYAAELRKEFPKSPFARSMAE